VHPHLFWFRELPELKQASIDTYKLWKLCDRPRDALVNRLRLESNVSWLLDVLSFNVMWNLLTSYLITTCGRIQIILESMKS